MSPAGEDSETIADLIDLLDELIALVAKGQELETSVNRLKTQLAEHLERPRLKRRAFLGEIATLAEILERDVLDFSSKINSVIAQRVRKFS